MATVRDCPKCNRPNGPKFTRCMYCGTDLPALAAPAPAADVDVVAEGRKARALLDGLTDTARAMMPVEVLEKLEAQAAAGEAARAGQAEQAPVAVTPEDTEPSALPPGPQSPYDVPEPSPEGDPSIPDLEAVEPFDVQTIQDEELEPYDSVRLAADAALGALTSVDDSDVDFETALRNALERGGGPFGKREAEARVILLPDPEYRGQAHWLRHRLAAATGMDLYTATQTLQRDVPGCLLQTETFAEAEEAADHLREAGLKILTIARSAWLDDALPDPAIGADLGSGDVVRFARPDGTAFEVARDDLRAAVIGEIEPDTAKVPMVPERDKRWGVAVAPDRPALDVGSGPFVVLDLLRASTRRPIRVRSDDFDFRCLGDDRGLAAGLNLRILLKKLGIEELNDRFKRVPHVAGLPVEGGDARGRPLTRREVEFTEYVLIVDAPNHL